MWAHMCCCCCCFGVCKLCYAFRNSPRLRCSTLELAFSTAKIISFSKVNGKLSVTWNTSLLDLLLVYRAASHSSNCNTIIIYYNCEKSEFSGLFNGTDFLYMQ